MVLTVEDRGMLDSYIDSFVIMAKKDAKTYADEEVRKAFHIKNSDDFVFGVAYGGINASFSGYFVAFHQRQLNAEELVEVSEIVLRRLPEIKKSISFEE